MISAVTLDFWNTLADDYRLEERQALRAVRLREIVGPHGYEPDDLAVQRAFSTSWDHFDRVWYDEHRTPTTAESTDVMLGALGVRLPQDARERVVDMLAHVVLDTAPRPVEGVPETLPVLAERYRLAVICDAGISPGSVLREVLASFGIDGHIGAFFFSDEHGFSKPDPRAFLTPLAELDVSPYEAVHVGDIQRTDIEGAHGAGLRAVHFVGVNGRDLKRSSAEAILYRFSDLPAVLESLR
jgi:putative hydrolase of the HAD superfamily